MYSLPVIKENKPSNYLKILSWLLIVVIGIGALLNIYLGNITHPKAFFVVLIGFISFVIGKLSVILKKQKISFGTKLMTENMANLYRVGYWLMIVGLIATFMPL